MYKKSKVISVSNCCVSPIYVQVNTVLAKPDVILDDLGYPELTALPMQKIRDSDHLYMIMKSWEDGGLAR